MFNYSATDASLGTYMETTGLRKVHVLRIWRLLDVEIIYTFVCPNSVIIEVSSFRRVKCRAFIYN